LSDLGGRVEFARFVHDGSEVKREEIDPAQKANTIRMGGLPPGTLTLKLPVRQPDVLVPVVELSLRL
jgi:alpha-L-fucosidase